MCILLCRIKTMKFILLSLFLLPRCCWGFINHLCYMDHRRKLVVKVCSRLEFQTLCVPKVQWASCVDFFLYVLWCRECSWCPSWEMQNLWPRPISSVPVSWWWSCLPLPPCCKCCVTYSAEPRPDAECFKVPAGGWTWLEDLCRWLLKLR